MTSIANNIHLPTTSKVTEESPASKDTGVSAGVEGAVKEATSPSQGTGVMGGVAGALNKAFTEKRNKDTFE